MVSVLISSARRRVVSAVLLAGVVAGCGGNGSGAGSGDLEVVASFYPLAEAAERVAGDRATVSNLTPAGSEPHDLELATDQVEDLEDADLVVVLGRGFQPAVEQVAERREGPTLELLRELPVPAEGDVAEEGAEGLDPHVWLDPMMMASIVEEVAASLEALDPEGAELYAANAVAYRAELEELGGRYEAALSGCRRSTIVVAHEAFGWLTARYDLTQEGVAGLSPEAEPSPARLAELSDLVTELGITTVFTESLVSPRVAEALAREAGVEVAVLDPIEGISEERLADGAGYTSVMEENLEVLTEALGCA
ncbi:MAG: zinc ABC transporter substrate-binding protein [Actinomycetota bacterium]|nr:zinc ABC transporter substrate-binding protein [Actinomycetota bacterium]